MLHQELAPLGRSRDGMGGLVSRPRLFEVLDRAVTGRVTVSALPGSGKTVLLRSWLDQAGLAAPVIWVSVEPGEDAGLLSALDRRDALDGPEARREPVVLVIDDLHELRSASALDRLGLLLVRMPPLVHVVLISRHDPHLGLGRLRVAGELTEIRAADLRFTLDETRQLLAAAGIVLAAADLALLHDKTEGWAAGLRLAAMALASHPQPHRFVAEFSGTERTVADYLLAEALDRQPPDVHALLLRTSIVDRVSGPLADFLTGGSGSERMLQALEDQNAFVASLDAGRSWFRYHRLFGDLLRLQLRRHDPDLVTRLHAAAARWQAEHEHPRGMKPCGMKPCGMKPCGMKLCGMKLCGMKLCGMKRAAVNRHRWPTRSAAPSCACCGTCPAACPDPRSAPSCSSRPTRSGPTSVTSTTSSACIGAPKRSGEPASSACSRPLQAALNRYGRPVRYASAGC